MATPDTSPTEPDALASLEERVLRAVQLVSQLRSENEGLRKQMESDAAERESASTAMAALQSEHERLNEELDSLRSERKHVRTRIEKLLGQMGQLSE